MRTIGMAMLVATMAAAVAAPAQVAPAPTASGNVKTGVDAWVRGDFRAAVEQWRAPATAGDPDAQFNMGQAYKLGRGVPLDPVLAASWFRKAAVQGHEQAEDNYGLALFQAGDKRAAVPWLEKSVARGDGRAELVLGTMLFNGDGAPRDIRRAYALMTLASQKDIAAASETLAQMDQYVSPPDRERALVLVQQMTAQQRPRLVGSATAPADPQTARAAAPPPPVMAAPAADKPARAAPVTRVAAVAKPKAALPAPPATARGGAWKIQLGAFRSRANAENQWRIVRARIGGAQPSYVAAGPITRLIAGGFPTRNAAAQACKASGVPCLVVS